jgi:molybdopterin molybdotransferase/putative molybdopterin biosynthesis protein
VRDDPDALSDVLAKAVKEADLVVFSGGTSKGSEDYTHTLLSQKGELICHGVASVPGRPLAMALVDGKPVINVAGPPIACFCGIDWCVRAVIDAFFGHATAKRYKVPAKLAGSLRGPGPRMEVYVRLNLEKTEDGYIAHPISHFGGNPVEAIRSEGLYIKKLNAESTEEGDMIEVELVSLYLSQPI